MVTDPIGGLTTRPEGHPPAAQPWRTAGLATPHAPGPVEARRRPQADAGTTDARPLVGPVSRQPASPASRGADGVAAGWSGRRSSGFLAQWIGQNAEAEDGRTPHPGRLTVGAYEKTARFAGPPAVDREGLVVMPPLSSGRAVDLSI